MTPAQSRAWRALVTTSLLLVDRLERQTQAAAGMPHAYYALLVALVEAPGRRLRAGELADAARISRSRLTHAVASMERSGWVTRRRAAGDGRGQVVVLTASGVAAVRRLAPLQVADVRLPALAGLDDAQLDDIAATLTGVAARLQALADGVGSAE